MSAAAPAVGVRVHYDFASSLCYVAHRAMQRLASELAAHGIALEWSPVDLTLLTGWRRGAELYAVRRANVERPAVLARSAEDLLRRTREAGDRGGAGVPSFVLGEWPIAGIQCDATMLSLLSRYAVRRREVSA